MDFIFDLFWVGIVGWLIYLYVRNTNRVLKGLIEELEHKKKLHEQETNNTKD
jgi:hypothetical protein